MMAGIANPHFKAGGLQIRQNLKIGKFQLKQKIFV
jgi:hypothetical protein